MTHPRERCEVPKRTNLTKLSFISISLLMKQESRVFLEKGGMLYDTFLNYHDTPSLRGRVIDISPSLPAMALFLPDSSSLD